MKFTRGPFLQRIDGRWELEDLTIFSSEWEKLYSFYFHLMSGRPLSADTAAFPWKGGYSTVNFFEALRDKVPPDYRPQLRRLQYASPGWIELELAIEVGQQVATLIGLLAGSLTAGFGVYYAIHSQLTKLKLTKIDAKLKELDLAKQYDAFISESLDDLAPYVGDKLSENIIAMAPNKLAALKMELTLFRRLAPLAKMQERGLLRDS